MQDGAGESTKSLDNEIPGDNHVILPSNIRPSNCVRISRPKEEIKGTWVIDPQMKTEKQDWNLELVTKQAIDAEVFLLPSTHNIDESNKPCMIRICGGRVSLNIHFAYPERTRLPMALGIAASQIFISLPRSFRGTLLLRGPHRTISHSPGVQSNLTFFSEEDDITKEFIGIFDSNWPGWDNWSGDVGDLESSDGIFIRYEDERNVNPEI